MKKNISAKSGIFKLMWIAKEVEALQLELFFIFFTNIKQSDLVYCYNIINFVCIEMRCNLVINDDMRC